MRRFTVMTQLLSTSSRWTGALLQRACRLECSQCVELEVWTSPSAANTQMLRAAAPLLSARIETGGARDQLHMQSLHSGLSFASRCTGSQAARDIPVRPLCSSAVTLLGPSRHPQLIAPLGCATGARRVTNLIAHSASMHHQLPMDAPGAQHMPMEDDVLDLFSSAMPKEEIGALRFLKDYPEYDGRGVVIAILDTGVCPGAAGLSVTTDGKPKILDIVDCTGSGDVDTSTSVKIDNEGYIAGASGSRLRVNPEWANPTGEWRVGCTHAYRLFPDALVSRIKKERRRQWDEQQRLALTAAASDLAAWERAGKTGPDASKEKAEFEGRLAYLKDSVKQYEDHGPVIDCVVWHDGSCWRAALDTRELLEAATSSNKRGGDGNDGALERFVPMTDYKAERRHGVFSYLDSCTYVLNIYDSGNTLSIVVDCGAHGTHVAGITAANFPDDPAMNGIAPGAQIISCKIGDTRLDAIETGTALTRALITVLEHKCQLINMSFGEPTCTPNKGRFVELANELVYKHGVIFVASAGNNGPALSTVSAPGGTSSAILGIGAFVSPGFAEVGHSVAADIGAGQQYTWCSRGPTADGYGGVAFSAPGGAISPVPTWTLQKRQLMNGTSMAAPNACGGIALILSGLQQLEQRRSKAPVDSLANLDPAEPLLSRASAPAAASGLPVRVRRALDATCLPLGVGTSDSVLTYGRGLIQVDAAFEYLQRAEAVDAMAIRYDVSVTPSSGSPPSLPATRGIYLRQAAESSRACSYNIAVTPVLPDCAPNSARLSVEDRIALEVTNVCGSSSDVSGGKGGATWVTCPSSLLLHHSGRSFELRVDSPKLPPGLHYAEVCGYDATARWRGPLFRVPITVIRPLPAPAPLAAPNFAPPNMSLGPFDFNPGTEHRTFIDVPAGATWAEILFRAGPHQNPRVYVLKATQLQQQLSYKRSETGTQLTLSGRGEWVWSVPVVPSSTLELTLAQYWSCMGPSTLGVEVCFHGVQLEGASGAGGASGASDWTGIGVTLDGSAGIKRMVAQAPLRNERLRPEARLASVQWGLRPYEYKAEPLITPRDTLPEGRAISRLLLSYKLGVTEPGYFTLRTPSIGQHVYDAVLESQTMMIYDCNKKLIQVSDVFPESCNLKKGDYTVRVMLRHENPELLEKMTALPVLVSRKMDSSITIPIYASMSDAVTSSFPLTSEFLVRQGIAVPLFLGPMPDERLPKDATQGRTLVGTVALGLTQKGTNGSPTTIPLTYIVPAPKQSNGNGAGNGTNGSADSGDGAAERALQLALRDAKIRFLKDIKLGLSGPEGEQYRALYNSLLEELKQAYPGHLPLLQQHLNKMDTTDNYNSGVAGLQSIVAAANELIAAIDEKEVMLNLAVKCLDDTPEAKKKRSDMEERKSILVSALHRKCCALMEILDKEDQQQDEAEQAKSQAGTLVHSEPEPNSRSQGVDMVVVLGSEQGQTQTGLLPVVDVPSEDEEGEPAAVEAGSAVVQVEAAVEVAAPSASAAVVNVEAASTSTSTVDTAKEFQQTFAALRMWVDTAINPDYAIIHAKAEARAKRYVSALQALDRALGDDFCKPWHRDMQALKQKTLAKLGWAHLEKVEKAVQRAKYPRGFQPF